MNEENRNTGKDRFWFFRKFLSCLPAFLIIFSCSPVRAGDAVAIGYNADGVWTSVTYFSSGTPKGGPRYKNEEEAREFLFRPHPMIEDKRPIDVVILSEFGAEMVVDILGGLKYGSAA